MFHVHYSSFPTHRGCIMVAPGATRGGIDAWYFAPSPGESKFIAIRPAWGGLGWGKWNSILCSFFCLSKKTNQKRTPRTRHSICLCFSKKLYHSCCARGKIPAMISIYSCPRRGHIFLAPGETRGGNDQALIFPPLVNANKLIIYNYGEG